MSLKQRSDFWGPLAIILLLIPATAGNALAQSCPLYGFGAGMMGGTWGSFGGIFMLLFWILIIAAGIYLVRWLAGGDRRLGLPGPPVKAGSESPLDILKKRYALGEIGKDQFESMKRDLQ